MTKFITRKVPYTNIVFMQMDESGQMVQGAHTVEGLALNTHAARRYLIRNKITSDNVIVVDSKTTEVLMKCPLSEFIAHATIVE